ASERAVPGGSDPLSPLGEDREEVIHGRAQADIETLKQVALYRRLHIIDRSLTLAQGASEILDRRVSVGNSLFEILGRLCRQGRAHGISDPLKTHLQHAEANGSSAKHGRQHKYSATSDSGEGTGQSQDSADRGLSAEGHHAGTDSHKSRQ